MNSYHTSYPTGDFLAVGTFRELKEKYRNKFSGIKRLARLQILDGKHVGKIGNFTKWKGKAVWVYLDNHGQSVAFNLDRKVGVVEWGR